MRMKTGEIVALLGRSGLRQVDSSAAHRRSYASDAGHGEDLAASWWFGPAKEVAMVFQSFALFPWLDVLDNVEIGPRSNGVPLDETRKRALESDRHHRPRRI